MKWNATTTIAACILIGLGGFLLGKLSTPSSVDSEADRLLEQSRQVTDSRRVSGSNLSADPRSSSRRPVRPEMNRSNASFDERLGTMEEIVRGENALDRGRAMLEWIDSLSPEEFEDAVERFRSLGLTEARMGEYAMLLTAWAEVDPTAALAYTSENTRGGMATNTVLSAWASRDPEAAIAWANAKHEGDGANPYMVGIIRGLVENDPSRATELIQELPFSRERGEALAAMMPHLLKMGPESARAWIAELSDERLRNGAIARFSEAMAKDDPAGTASWLLANLSDASSRSVDNVYREWASQDQAAALSSFQQITDQDARSRALRGIVTSEARQDPQAAADLMSRYPEDVDDRMVRHFIWNSFDKAPDIAVNQIGLMKNDRWRDRMYERALDAWLDRDPNAAQTWINSAELPESVLKSLSNRTQP